jgi:general stress protein 13
MGKETETSRMAYRIGQIVEGKITGIQPYGAFVSLDHHTSGLIHISEISDGYVRDVGEYVHVGDTVSVKIIDFDAKTSQARLSLKALRHTHVRSQYRPMGRKGSPPVMKIGFRSIAEKLPQWIREAQEEKTHEV